MPTYPPGRYEYPPGPVLSAEGRTLSWTPIEDDSRYRVQRAEDSARFEVGRVLTFIAPGPGTYRVKSKQPYETRPSNRVTVI